MEVDRVTQYSHSDVGRGLSYRSASKKRRDIALFFADRAGNIKEPSMVLQDVIFEIRPDEFAAAEKVKVAVLRAQVKRAPVRSVGSHNCRKANNYPPSPIPAVSGTSRKMSHHVLVNWY
jgi:hypothetical protein